MKKERFTNKPQNKSGEHFIDLVAHDIRGIITKIDRISELLSGKLQTTGDREVSLMLSYLKTLCRQGNNITNDLIVSCELESGAAVIGNEQSIPLNKIIKEQAKIYRLLAVEKNILLSISVPRKNIYCNIDGCKFIRIIDNLFSNALKFTGRNGHITITVSAKGTNLTVAVGDSGIGIPAGLQPEIFNKYTKARRYGTENESCTGLGLYIVKKIVEMYGGKIWFESKENKGTTFYVVI
ncbi:MAG: HAMP domain-containing histidine kinase [Bacteroidetes bacterium]|nr:HAMP domain-containing histidine kinase [Bacteroidota bacterium]